MDTGNTRDFRNDAGKLVLDCQPAILKGDALGMLPHSPAGECWFASFRGWGTDVARVGTAASRDGAIRDLATQSGSTFDAVLQESEVIELESKILE